MTTKRCFDVVLACVLLICLLPAFLLLSVLIFTLQGSPVIFSQKRIGKNFIPFAIYKFRTMQLKASKQNSLTIGNNDLRITPLGKFLRKYKLDEFPQLINILLGQMSFVGPRPELEKYVAYYPNEYQFILSVSPGLTDYASIAFINEAELLENTKNPEAYFINTVMPQKIALQKKYVSKNNLIIDVKLLFITVVSILKASSS